MVMSELFYWCCAQLRTYLSGNAKVDQAPALRLHQQQAIVCTAYIVIQYRSGGHAATMFAAHEAAL